MCRSAIKLDLSPSVALRDMVSILLKSDGNCANQQRLAKIQEDMGFYKRHISCIRLGAHCSAKMCLRPKIQPNTEEQ